MAPRETGRRRLRRALLAVGVAAVLAAALYRLATPPSGPAEVPLDAARCAHCGMLVSDVAFAAQLRLETGEVRFFDDPGCLLRHLGELRADGARLDPLLEGAYVHHLHEARWIPLAEARFVPVPHSPMGDDLGARGPAAREGVGWAEALEMLSAPGHANEGARP